MEKFITFWNKYKKPYKYGEDYIDISCGKYIAIISFNFPLLNGMDFLPHCFTKRDTPFTQFTHAYLISPKRETKLMKVIVVDKNIKMDELSEVDKSIKNYKNQMSEFTFWLSQKEDDNFLYGLHDHRNYGISTYISSTSKPEIRKGAQDEYEFFLEEINQYVNKIRDKFIKNKKRLIDTAMHNVAEYIVYNPFVFSKETVKFYNNIK